MRSATVLFQWGGDGGAHRLAAPSEAKNPRSSDSELYQGFESITLDGPTSVAQLVAFVEGEYVELARSFEPAEKAVRA